jgi:Zn-dependent peptidase ImmA (M78 family)
VSYDYTRRSRDELREIASQILKRFQSRRRGYAVDIEGILEDLGLDIIYRPSLGLPVEAYAARNPQFIVMREDAMSYPPRGRFTMAEEVCHRILEYELWGDETLPEGARVHELTDKQHETIERDARALAAEILQPEASYRQRFEFHRAKFAKQLSISGDRLIRASIRAVAVDFEVSMQSAAYRARVLDLISATVYKRVFPPML